MELTEEHKKEVERKLVEVIIDSLEKNLISVGDKDTISAFILGRALNVRTHEELITFLRELSSKWSIFSPLLVIESGEVKEKNEDRVVDKVQSLTQEGKIDEAINMAKTTVSNT